MKIEIKAINYWGFFKQLGDMLGSRRGWCILLLSMCVLSISGCSIFKKSRNSGGYFQNDGPGKPSRLDPRKLRDAVPRVEPLKSGSNKPYTVNGKRYVPDIREIPYKRRGMASWYGKQFHGRKTSSGEVYDMYAMTAAHTTLPIPCYVRVTNISNRRSIIVRVNDRGPFSNKRLIDLSYGAAYKLGFVEKGTTEVIVERILPADIRSGNYKGSSGRPQALLPASPDDGIANGLSQGFYVQVGAYGQPMNAQIVFNQLVVASRSLQAKPHTQFDGRFYKVYLGPYKTQSQARRAANKIERRLGERVVILDHR